MSRCPDILYMAEYIKNILYFATVRQGKVLKSTMETHYFSIDEELIYENYYSDFGPLNLGCVYKYCIQLNELLKQHLNKQIVVHYTSIDPRKKANAAYLLGCYGVLYLNLSPKDALRPLQIQGQTYRPFQDASQGESVYTISILDCLQGISKAQELGLFNFQDFNYDEYERLDKIQGGDLNWIIPGKFLAFIGPVDYSVSLFHPPEMYIDYFLENNVKVVVRLNKRLYDANVFNNAGIVHYDLFFPDGSCPPRHILFKFLQISEESDGSIAVHCKAGLGRTGSLIGCYIMKHYRMTAYEAIAWMRICRPGSVIGHQQGWLVQLEPWLIKQGNLFRKRMYRDTEKLPYHKFGVYSIAEKQSQRPVLTTSKSPSPTRTSFRQNNLENGRRPQSSKVRDENPDEEIFLTACDLTTLPTESLAQIKGCVIKNNDSFQENNDTDHYSSNEKISIWRKYLCCQPCSKICSDGCWILAVRGAKITPKSLQTTKLCCWFDMVAADKKSEKDSREMSLKEIRTKPYQKLPNKWDVSTGISNSHTRRGIGAGEPRISRQGSRASTAKSQGSKNSNAIESNGSKHGVASQRKPALEASHGTIIRNMTDARIFLMKSKIHAAEKEKQLNAAVIVTPQMNYRTNYYTENVCAKNFAPFTPSIFRTGNPTSPPPPATQTHRRRLGRSPSPIQKRTYVTEQTRATNTISLAETLAQQVSRTTLKEALSRLKLTAPHRDSSLGATSVGAGSLGARRTAPMAPLRAPSVRSDERQTATQGDMLNSIKFQRRLRETLNSDKLSSLYNEKKSQPGKEKPGDTRSQIRSSVLQKQTHLLPSSRQCSPVRGATQVGRPMSPKGRRDKSNK